MRRQNDYYETGAGGVKMQGKQKCRILKEIRQRIADENDIPYVTRECTFQGECRGTCPRCESELRYLERELALRASIKKGVTVAALCAGMAGMAFAATGCSNSSSVPETGTESDLSGAYPMEDEPMELTGEIDEASYYKTYGGEDSTSESAVQDCTLESACKDGTSKDAAQSGMTENASWDDTGYDLTGVVVYP